MNFAILMLAVPFVVLLVGIALVRTGLRGRVIDQHPCCGRCGYDLVDADPTAACPECGASADEPRRIRNRTPKPRRAAVGFVMICVSTLVLSGVIYRSVAAGSYRSLEPLRVLRSEAGARSLPAIDEIGRRIRGGALSNSEVALIVDQALVQRHADWVGLRATWGDVVDAALSSGQLDPARTRQCLDQAIGVHWNGTSELFKDISGASVGSDILFVFAPAVGWRSTIGFDADIESAQVDDIGLSIERKQTGVYYHHVRNSAPRDTFISVGLPSSVAGKKLIVRWRIKIKDATTGAPLAEDWVHTETIAVPASGDGFLSGSRSRFTGSESAGQEPPDH